MSTAVRLLLAASLLGPAPSALAQASIPLTVTGNEARGAIQLPGGLGAELTLSFEQVVGLNPQALLVSARVVDPLDPSLPGRLPAGGGVSLLAGFPVGLRIDPSAESTLSFSGVYTISLYTHNLTLPANFSTVLYSGPNGGALSDLTSSVTMGSYRGRGTGGGFSDFIIVADARPIDAIILEKFDALDDIVAATVGSVPSSVVTSLQNRLARARTFYSTGATAAAIAELNAFGDYVKAQSGSAIPDVWRAHDDRINYAGHLRSQAATLTFSLNVKASRSP